MLILERIPLIKNILKIIIIILGSARSGSTLLAKTIGGHSACFTLGEINRFNQEINNPKTHCGCGKKLNKCDFWIHTLKELNIDFGTSVKDNTHDFNVGIFKQITKISKFWMLIPTILFGKKYKNSDIENEIKNTFILYQKIFNKTGSKVLIDSTKGLFRGLILQSRSPENIQFKFIQLIRDGRGVLNSEMKTSYVIRHNDGIYREYKGRINKNYKRTINSWIYVNLRNFVILKLFRNQDTLNIKYENFTENPEKYLKQIYSKINLEYEVSALNLDEGINHILGGNASRMNAKKINRRDDAWVNKLDKNMLKTFNIRAGWFNKLMGY